MTLSMTSALDGGEREEETYAEVSAPAGVVLEERRWVGKARRGVAERSSLVMGRVDV
jgi:hypothetical protein